MGQRGSRFDRSSLIEAAHSVIVMTAYFDSLRDGDLKSILDRFGLSRAEQVATSTGAPVAPARELARTVLDAPAPLPSPHWGNDRIKIELRLYYRWLSDRLINFFHGLAAWETLAVDDREVLVRRLREELPSTAVSRYQELLLRLACDVPDVRMWLDLREHDATRDLIRHGFAELEQILCRFPTTMARRWGSRTFFERTSSFYSSQ